MPSMPTVKIVNPKKTAEFLIINEDDFDAAIDILWEDKDNMKKKPGPKPKKEAVAKDAKKDDIEEAPDHRI